MAQRTKEEMAAIRAEIRGLLGDGVKRQYTEMVKQLGLEYAYGYKLIRKEERRIATEEKKRLRGEAV